MDSFSLIILCIIIGVVVSFFAPKSAQPPQKSNIARTAPPATATPTSTWWNNLERTPLSDSEARRVAYTVAKYFSEWMNSDRRPQSTVRVRIKKAEIGIDSYDAAVDNNGSGKHNGYKRRVVFSHSISCQADRKHIAEHIISCIKEDYPHAQIHFGARDAGIDLAPDRWSGGNDRRAVRVSDEGIKTNDNTEKKSKTQ